MGRLEPGLLEWVIWVAGMSGGMSLSLWHGLAKGLGQGQSSRHWVSDWWAYR